MLINRRAVLFGLGGVAMAASSAAAKPRPLYVVGAINWRGTKAQLFLTDGTYNRVDLDSGEVEPGYPKPIDNRTWPGLGAYARDIIAACDGPNDRAYFFFADGTYARYDVTRDRVENGYPRRIDNETWPGLGPYANLLSSALRWKDGKLQFFLSDGRYLRYDIAADCVDPGYPKPVNDRTWPGLDAYKYQLAGMFNLRDRKAYMFLTDGGTLRYDIQADRLDLNWVR